MSDGHSEATFAESSATVRCAICGGAIVSGAVRLAGWFGKGWRHSDSSLCMERLRDAPDD